jgi:signal transduction histidine kinase
VEYRVLTLHGDLIWWRDTGQAIWDEQGVPLFMAGACVDVTGRRLAEEALARYGDQLEQLVEERTAELKVTQEELVKKERLATLGKLTGMVSHELRNPLGTIRSSLFSVAERLQGKDLGVDKALERAERAIVRCDGIIEEMLDYTRVHRPVLESTALDSWLEGVLDEQPPPRGIRVIRRLLSGATIHIDQQRIRRSLVNVLSNAFESIRGEDLDREQGVIEVETAFNGDRAEIRVSDNGVGIKPEDLGRICEPLFSTKSFGVGLGLTIVRNTMEMHCGEIDIRSKPCSGTTVILRLPLTPEVSLSPASREEVSPGP